MRILAAAKAEGPDWYLAVCLAGEAGLRVGEVKALRWREDVDMIARTIPVNQQTRNNEITTPKGRTRRTIPMTGTLYAALHLGARGTFVPRKDISEPKPRWLRLCRQCERGDS